MLKKTEKPICGLDYAFKRIGGKYKARILWILYTNKIMRYGELRRALPDATPKMLAQSLREMEEDKMIVREEYKEIPPRVEYSLDDLGFEIVPFVKMLGIWGNKKIQQESKNQIYCENYELIEHATIDTFAMKD